METAADRVAKHGKSVISNLFILLRITGIYNSMNETILNSAKRLLADMGPLLQENGEFTIKIMQGTFFIEGVRIKTGVSDIEAFSSLAAELENREIGALTFRAPLKEENLITLAYAVRAGQESSAIQSAMEEELSLNIMVSGPVIMQQEEGIDLRDSEAVAKRAYVKAISAMREMDGAVKAGRRTKLKRIKRALQLVVDSIVSDETYLLGYVISREFDHYYYHHPVHVSIFSAALGKRIGMDRVQLRTLAMAAFFHDAGKVEIPLSILDKETAFTPKEEELIKRHPGDGIRILLRSLGLNEISIISMIVSLEHHMKFNLSGYPVTSKKRTPNLFSRIVSIADDFDSLLSGKVYERKSHTVRETMRVMLRGSGTTYDPSLLKAFAGIFQ